MTKPSPNRSVVCTEDVSHHTQALVEQCRQLDISVESGSGGAVQQPHTRDDSDLRSSPSSVPLVLPKVCHMVDKVFSGRAGGVGCYRSFSAKSIRLYATGVGAAVRPQHRQLLLHRPHLAADVLGGEAEKP